MEKIQSLFPSFPIILCQNCCTQLLICVQLEGKKKKSTEEDTTIIAY